jgi:phospholipid/cholesterol/gamma-HCH transport system permease protein
MQLTSILPLRQVAFLGQVVLSALSGFPARWRFRGQDFARVAADCSARAVPIVTIVNVLVGAILAFVGAVQLIKFGAGIYVADLVAIAVSREMAAIITAVVMAGRTGAAFAAELATMQTNEEVDALEVLGLNAVDFLVLPRVLALFAIMPLLYVYACVTGLIGGMLVAAGMLDLAPAAYMDRTVDALSWTHIGLGLAKSIVFGAMVAITGCYFGLTARRDAAGVGIATTRAVVVSIVAVIVIDAVFAVCADALGI